MIFVPPIDIYTGAMLNLREMAELKADGVAINYFEVFDSFHWRRLAP